ncbi:MAG: hypothetical protein K9G47_06870, partial [Bacteroidales bacterium]|nr:hypothetical protein [Bacteroidales bacterium]
SVIIVSVLFVLILSGIGWLGGFIFNLSWWNAGTFSTVAMILNLILFPIYISGALEGLAYRNESRYKLYAFLYAFLIFAVPYTIGMLWDNDLSVWPYVWSFLYGLYSVWLATKMID